ncbi:MAG: hypothetical protein JXR36_08095 [Bacteroidales bacterium]|nr:hypothetical protein [Bacteroidales bacterium]
MKQKQKIFDDQPWYVNHASPLSKWLFNFSFLGFKISNRIGIIWIVIFNPLAVMLCIVGIIVLAIALFLA